MESIEKHRQFLKNHGWEKWDALIPDQKRGISPPDLQKPCSPGTPLVGLGTRQSMTKPSLPLVEAIGRRRSIREYTDEPLSLQELSFLLWTTQGVHEIGEDGSYALRSVPSAGARHPFETYLIVKNIVGLEPGLYRYLALDHKLCFLRAADELAAQVSINEWLLSSEAVLFIWTAVPYRTEWRYSILSHKMIAIEAGHICQNLYLAGVAIGAGTCAIGAFSQDEIDGLLAVDGEEEFAVYMASVGKII